MKAEAIDLRIVLIQELSSQTKGERTNAVGPAVPLSTFLAPYGWPASFTLVVFVRRIKAVIVPRCVLVIDRVILSSDIIKDRV